MKVLLLQSVSNVGRAGDVKEVADGYARNYLIPRRLATIANAAAVKNVNVQREAEERREARHFDELKAQADQIAATELHFKAKVGEQHRLYGSITSADIA